MIAALLDESNPEALAATPELRYVRRLIFVEDGPLTPFWALQQHWACLYSGKSEWRDVPVVREEKA